MRRKRQSSIIKKNFQIVLYNVGIHQFTVRKMARKSALPLVISQMIPVDPKGGQPAYYRSKRSVQTSSRLKSFQSCMAEKLQGKTYSNREEVRAAFASAAKSC